MKKNIIRAVALLSLILPSVYAGKPDKNNIDLAIQKKPYPFPPMIKCLYCYKEFPITKYYSANWLENCHFCHQTMRLVTDRDANVVKIIKQ